MVHKMFAGFDYRSSICTRLYEGDAAYQEHCWQYVQYVEVVYEDSEDYFLLKT